MSKKRSPMKVCWNCGLDFCYKDRPFENVIVDLCECRRHHRFG